MPATEKIICPICQHVNPPDAVQCEQCKVSFTADSSTVDVSESLSQMAVSASEQIRQTHEHLAPDDVVFYVAGEIQPLVIQSGREIILGRSVDDAPSFVVDMTQFHGHLLGVSRKHALLTRVVDGYTVEDLDSTNGTWLNDERLVPRQTYPVISGDQLRIGQLVLFVYFAMPADR